MRALPFFRVSAVALVALAAVTLSACDTYYDEPVDVYVADFSLDGDAYALSADGRVASYESDDINSSTERDAVRRALRSAGDGAVVMAYIDSELVLDVTGTGQTYSALPITRGFEGTVLVDQNGDGTPEEVPFVDFFVTYEYSFDNEDFYFDFVSTAAIDFADFVPADIDLRVVAIPATVFNKMGTVDLTNYEAVKAAFNLPD
jgi:hypothetical protein